MAASGDGFHCTLSGLRKPHPAGAPGAFILSRASGEQIKSCTMNITEPNDFVAEVHNRMPVLLTEDPFVPWLRGGSGTELLRPAPNDYLQRWPVSKRVNSSKTDADDATLIEPVEVASV
jgi:putative SOS response-associated peptidase YedK